jgi:hypothetical protein
VLDRQLGGFQRLAIFAEAVVQNSGGEVDHRNHLPVGAHGGVGDARLTSSSVRSLSPRYAANAGSMYPDRGFRWLL